MGMFGAVPVPALLLAAAVVAVHAQLDGPAQDVRLVTFNTGLTPFSTGLLTTYATRLPAILRTLGSDEVFTTADVVCLQELRATSDLLLARASLTAAGLANHYAFYDDLLPQYSSDQPACDLQATQAALVCAATTPLCMATAASASPAILFVCLTSQCQDMWRVLKPTCLPCVADWRVPVQDFGNLTAAVLRCSSTARQRDYVPTYGLSLSSRVALTNVRYRAVLNGTTQTLVRGFIQATHPTIGEVSCTHQTTTSGFSQTGFPAPDGFANFNAISETETNAIISTLGSQQGVAMGDQNSSPTLPGITSDSPTVYQAYIDAGFRSSLVQANNVSCTYCLANPLDSVSPDSLIDHIFVSSHLRDAVVSADVVLQANITGQAFPLSDHYAVRAVVNTGSRYSIELSRWVRSFGQWNVAYQEWLQNGGRGCPAAP